MEIALKDVIQFSILLVGIVGAYWNLRVRMTRLEDNKADRTELFACKTELAQKAEKDDMMQVKEELKEHIAKIYTALEGIKTLQVQLLNNQKK